MLWCEWFPMKRLEAGLAGARLWCQGHVGRLRRCGSVLIAGSEQLPPASVGHVLMVFAFQSSPAGVFSIDF